MFDWAGLFGSMGLGSIVLMLLLLGIMSQRLGKVSKAPAYYLGFYLGAALVMVGVIGRIIHLNDSIENMAAFHQSVLWIMVYNGIPAVGTTIGLILTWRYWSWLLAERE